MCLSFVLRRSVPIAARATAACLLLAGLAGGGPAAAEGPASDPVVAVVNGTPISESEIELADEQIGRNLPTQEKAERREEIIKMVIDNVLLSSAAVEQKIGDEADLQRRMAYARNQGLMRQILIATGQRAATKEALHQAYDHVVAIASEPELHLRQIIFKVGEGEGEAAKAEERAKRALARIADGEDFAKVAAEMSDDPVAKSNGGDFGWRIRNELGKEYAEAGFALKPGEIAPLIKTSFGLHIIRLDDKRIRKPLEFDQVRGKVQAMVMRNAQFELINKLRAEAKVERKDQPEKHAETQVEKPAEKRADSKP